jgi:peptide/nickel transport system permease protein
VGRKYYVERLLQAFVTLFAVVSLSFFLLRGMPGTPADYLKSQLVESQRGAGAMDPHHLERLTQEYMNMYPDSPLHIQYFNYMQEMVLHLNFGRSIWYQEPVTDILFQALPWTLFVMSQALILAFGVQVLLGAAMAYKEGTRFDMGSTSFALVAGSTPYYIIALLGLYFLGYQLEWFPKGGHYNQSIPIGLNVDFITSIFYHSALPVMSLVLARTAGAISMRANAVRVLGQDYIRVARLRGLPTGRIVRRYVARNAVLPEYTSLLISMGAMFGGSVILEQIFVYPGIGFYTFKAVETRDYPLLMGGFVLVTVTVVIGVLIGDLTYGLIDPRASSGGGRESY